MFGFVAAITAFAGIATGLAPALVASRLNLDEMLKQSGRRTTTGGAAQRLRALLMVSEVALALILLTGAGILIRSFVRLTSVHSIVGVVPSTRYLPLTTEPSPEVFICDVQHPQSDTTLILHATSDPASLAAAVRSKVQEVDRNQPVFDVATMEERFWQALAPQRFNALVLGIFAGVAVILAGVGVYGVMAYSVTRRTHEIGIRIALGAQRQDVLKLVLRHGVLLVASGIGLGVAGALALTRSLSSLLYGVKPTDPLTFIGVSLILISVALMASYIPARRATKVDPMVALRHE